MGIPRGVGRLLLDEARERPFSGTLLLLSRMTVYFTLGELRAWAKNQGVRLHEVEPRPSHVPNLAAIGCIDDVTLFRALGFSEVKSLDFSSWEGADYIADLNLPLPDELHGRFDAVFEAGTIQHVFHLPQVLTNIHALLKDGGRALHGMATCTNHVDHGFYMFSPTLFHDFYSENGWRIDDAFFYEFAPYWHRHRFESAPWKIYRYTPGCLDDLAYGGMGAAQMALFFAVTKTAGARADVIPQQSYFRRFWPEAEVEHEKAAATTPAVSRERLEGPGYGAFDGPILLAKRFRAWLRRRLPRRLPPLHARY